MQAQTPEVSAEKATTPDELRLVSVEQLKKIHRDLDACQKVIWLAGCRPHGYGFDPSYVTDAQERLKEIEALLAEPVPAQDEQHFDDRAVDRFAAAMKAKMAAARAKGRYGWFNRLQCPGKRLARMLIEHLSKGNEGTFEDIANFCMMLHQRGEDPQLLTDATRAAQTELVEALYHLSDVWAINADEHKEHGRLDEAEVLRGASRELRNSLRAALAAQGGE